MCTTPRSRFARSRAKINTPPDQQIRRTLDLITRRERGRLIAGLVNRLGSHHLDLAEDVAQEALLIALSIWPYRGIPDNPAAWLTRVARNKAVDRLRRESLEQPIDLSEDERCAIDMHRIHDPELRLMFLCCNPELNDVDRLALTLRVVSGFTALEIAQSFLSTPGAIAQRLLRGKRRLSRQALSIVDPPSIVDINSRMDAVLKVIYLMFSLGYSPQSGTQLIRRDVAWEALRLARETADQKSTANSKAQALAALLCLQASRFDAREDANGRPVLMKDQNRQLWDTSLIDLGTDYLQSAMKDRQVSRYHIEAGIASLYAHASSWDRIDWQLVQRYYDQLERMTESPVVTLNACVAQASSGDAEAALARLEAIGGHPMLQRYTPFFVARAEILRLLGHENDAIKSYAAAIENGASSPIIQHLEQRMVSGQ